MFRCITLGVSVLALVFGREAQAAGNETYQNPVDGETCAALGGWQTYMPQNPAPSKNERISLGEVRLLSPEDSIAASTSATEMAAFIQSVKGLAQETLTTSTQSNQLMLQFDCDQKSQKVRMAVNGNPERELLQKLYDAVSSMKPLTIRSGSISFQVLIKIADLPAASNS